MKEGDKIRFTGCKPGCSCEMGFFAPGDPFFKQFQGKIFMINKIWGNRDDIVSCKEIVHSDANAFHDDDSWGGVINLIFLAAHVSIVEG